MWEFPTVPFANNNNKHVYGKRIEERRTKRMRKTHVNTEVVMGQRHQNTKTDDDVDVVVTYVIRPPTSLCDAPPMPVPMSTTPWRSARGGLQGMEALLEIPSYGTHCEEGWSWAALSAARHQCLPHKQDEPRKRPVSAFA